MKLLRLSLIISRFLSIHSLTHHESTSSLSAAVDGILNWAWKSRREVSFENYGEDSKIMDTVVSHCSLNLNLPYKIRNVKQIDLIAQYEMSEFAIMTFGSIASFKNIMAKSVFTNQYPKTFQLFVHCQGAAFEDISALSVYYKQWTTLSYQYFLLEENEVIRLLTFIFFSPQDCDAAQLHEVNKFDKTTGKWEKQEFSVNKLANLHGCGLVFGVPLSNPATYYQYDKHGSYRVGGYVLQAVNDLEKILNSNFYYNPFNKTDKYFFDYVELLLKTQRYSMHNKSTFISKTFHSLNDVVAVSPAEQYNEYEKLLLPFDFPTWILISITFVAGFVTIFVVNLASAQTRHFVFGRNVSTPSLNILIIFFGVSQIKLPGRNFARFLVIMFAMYCMIIRTAWQGKTFEFMQKDMTKLEVKTIEEFIERNFTFYIRKQHLSVIKNFEYFKRLKTVTIDIYDEIYMTKMQDYFGTLKIPDKLGTGQVYEPSYKGGLYVDGSTKYILVSISQGQILKRFLSKPIATDLVGLEVPINHRLFEILERKLQQLFEGGFFEFYNKEEKLNDAKVYEVFEEIDGPKVLTMKHLEAGFVVWMVSISCAIVVFIFEWFIRFKDILMFKFIRSHWLLHH